MADNEEHEASSPVSYLSLSLAYRKANPPPPKKKQGASVKEQLIGACRGNNVKLLEQILDGRPDHEISRLLNDTTTVMGNHLYHEAAARGHYEIIDALLDMPEFECDPTNRQEGDTPLHTAIRWINSEPPAQREFGNALVRMMLEAGSDYRRRNAAGLTPLQLVDPRNAALRDLVRRHEFTAMNSGDYANVENPAPQHQQQATHKSAVAAAAAVPNNDDEDAEFSGSDDEERAEWERRRGKKGAR